jgi:phosphoribosyl 1,2-cyclic phosphodiesterase
MRIKFWGVRGTVPCPGAQTIKYGGNTACIEVRMKDSNRQIIIDAGSGIRELGHEMVHKDLPQGPISTEIFLTHTHLDHIVGFPFFTPIYIKGTKIKIYGPVTYEDDPLENVFSGQFTYRYFPIRWEELASELEFVKIREDRLDLGDGIFVTTKYLNHPVLCLGYRFEYKGNVFCTTYDTEPFSNVFCTDPSDPSYDEALAVEGERAVKEENTRIEAFFSGADVLVHDAQYTDQEYRASKKGWGHTSFEYVIEAAKRNGIKKLVLFHHDPARTDDQLDALAEYYCSPAYTGNMEVVFAREGTILEI